MSTSLALYKFDLGLYLKALLEIVNLGEGLSISIKKKRF